MPKRDRFSDPAALVAQWTDLEFLESKVAAGQLPEALQEMSKAAARLPADNPGGRLLRLLQEAIRRDQKFIEQHAQDYPQALFQCLWNSCWWYDCPQAADHYEPPAGGWKTVGFTPWEKSGPKLFELLERWRAEKEKQGIHWLEAGRPPAIPLGCCSHYRLEGHRGAAKQADFLGDGRRVMSSAYDGTVRVWDSVAGTLLCQIDVQFDNELALPTPVLVSRDSTKVLVIATNPFDTANNVIRIYDLASGVQTATLNSQQGLFSVILNVDDRRILSLTSGNSLRVWDMENAVEIACFSEHSSVQCFAASPDGSTIVSTGKGSSDIIAWDPATGQEIRRIECGPDDLVALEYSLDGSKLVAGDANNVVRVWDAKNGTDLARFDGPGPLKVVEFSPDGGRVLVQTKDSAIQIWDLRSRRWIANLVGHSDAITCFGFTLDGSRIATGSKDKTIRIWKVEGGVEEACLEGHEATVIKVDESDPMNAIHLIAFLMQPPAIASVRFSPDGSRLVSAGGDWTVRIWDANAFAAPPRLRNHAAEVTDIAFSSDGIRLATASADKTVRAWNATSGTELACLSGHEHTVSSIAFAPDGRRIASGSYDKTVRLWDVDERREIIKFDSHAVVGCVAFAPAGNRILGGAGWHVLIWDIAKQAEYACLAIDRDAFSRLAYSPDGERIATISGNGALKIWDPRRRVEFAGPKEVHSRVRRIAFSADSLRLVIEKKENINTDACACLCDVVSGEMTESYGASFDALEAKVNGRDRFIESTDKAGVQIKQKGSDATIAWYPLYLDRATTNPRFDQWAGIHGNELHMIRLHRFGGPVGDSSSSLPGV